MFIAALFTIAKIWKQPKCPSTDEWIKKMRYIYIYNGILLSHKKYELWGFPSGAVVNNPPANAGDMGSSPGPGRSHMLQSN